MEDWGKEIIRCETMEISMMGGHTCMGVNKCLNTQASANWIA